MGRRKVLRKGKGGSCRGSWESGLVFVVGMVGVFGVMGVVGVDIVGESGLWVG